MKVLILGLVALMSTSLVRTAEANMNNGYSSSKTSKSTKTNKVLESSVLEFTPGMASLSSYDQAKLSKLLKTAKSKGKITKVEVAVWSDKMHPSQGKDLPEVDRKLAKSRAINIEKSVQKDLGHYRYVKVFNMAEGTHWLAKVFDRSEAELDSVFAKKHKGAIKRENVKIIKDDGGPSKAVVIVTVKE